MANRLPALFIGHGSPMNALEDNAFTRGWQDAARRIPKPRAVVCISAHWETRGVGVTATPAPQTIHDFYGFPQALFDVRYPAPGDPALAAQIAQMVKSAKVHPDTEWGLDHGAWSVLRIMYPQADIPVLQLSLDSAQPGAFHYALGQELAPLRDDGVLVMGSGNIVHNLRLFDFHATQAADWAARADGIIRSHIDSGDHAALLDWNALGPEVGRGVPTPEHYLPLLYALAVRGKDEPVRIFNTTVISAISMTCMQVG
ncbi:MAG TPA: 4,5-DOPA dioxygenase extradiol [Rudaea sp.]|mgnify:CR=1 FL=1|nr:4,5-DOPA dioxygenase extradiol [Rudaea sp.]